MLSEAKARKLADEIFNQSEFSAFQTKITEYDALINREHKPTIPDFYEGAGIDPYYSYEAQYAYNLATQELLSAKPVLEVRSRALQADRRDGAQHFEDYGNRQFVLWRRVVPAAYDLTSGDQAGRGAGIYRLDLRSYAILRGGETMHDVWPKRPARNGQELKEYETEVNAYKLRTPTPFVLERVDPLCCAWERDADGICTFVEKSKRQVNAVTEAYGLGMGRDGKFYQLGPARPDETTGRKTVEFIELCTRDAIYHFVGEGKDRQLLGSYPNPFGAVRYVLALARIGIGPEAKKLYLPLIEPSLALADLDTDFGTALKYAAYRAGYPIQDLVNKETGAAWVSPGTNKARIYVHPMKPIEYDLPEGTEFKDRFETGTDLEKLMQRLDMMKQRYGLQDVLAGGSAGEREPAWSLALRGQSAQRPIDPAIRGQKVAIEEIFSQVAHCIKFWIKEPVLVWSIVKDELGREQRKQVKVSPEDIEEDFDLDVDMGYRNKAIQLAEKEGARRDRIEGQISEYRYQEEFVGLADPGTEQALIAVEKLDAATDAMALWETIEATLVVVSQEVGAPPPDPAKIAALRAATFQVAEPQAAEKRRPASQEHTSEEAPPTPIRQQVM